MATFAMLTVNADEHPLMRRFHRPDDEKRMVVILHPDDYTDWLSCRVAEARRHFRLWQGPLEAGPEPLPPRAPAASSVRAGKPRQPPAAKPPPPPPSTGDLFDG